MWWCVRVRSSRPCISCLPWLSLFRLICAALLVWLPFLGAAGLLSFVAAARCFVVVVVFLLVALVAWCLRFGPLFPVAPPLWLSPGFFWSSQCSAGPSLRISGCICNGPVVIPLVWRVVVDWLLSSLRSLATKASALCGTLPSTPCCGCCSCASRSVTRYSPSCDPVYPSDTAKAARARLLGFCCFLPPVLLPSRTSALSFLAGLRLFPSPRALVLLALSARLVVLCLGWCLWLLLLCVFGLSSWRSLFCGLFGLLGFVVLFVPSWFLCLCFAFGGFSSRHTGQVRSYIF